MPINILATWLYISPIDENIKYYQIKEKSSSKKFIEIYLKNIVCFFWSAKKFNTIDTKYLLFVNTDLPNILNNFDIIDYLNNCGIEIVKLENLSCNPPTNYYEAWTSQFILIDILKYFSHIDYEFNAIILDNDCLIINSLEIIYNEVGEKNILNYEIKYDDNYNYNGLTNKQLRYLFKIYHNLNIDKIKYFGGEFICFNNKIINEFYKESIRLYELSIERFKNNHIKYNTEEHLFSSVYHKLGYISANANKFIKRIWTNPITYTNFNGTENDLLIWHLPSEKGKGFNKLFLKIKNNHDNNINISSLIYLFRLKITLVNKLYYFFLKRLRNIILSISKA
jgi:hypothetical protein